jgi:hypothetical protein
MLVEILDGHIDKYSNSKIGYFMWYF